MSSFIGHSLAAVTVYVATEFILFPVAKDKSWFKRDRLVWLGWLIITASIPDLDYLVSAWNSTNNQGLRITHSVLFSLILPCLTISLLWIFKRCKNIEKIAIQVILAGLSHLILDFSVGVTPLPLLFSLVKSSFKLTFGILPSAGRIDMNNYYLYRNLLLEMGVLLPIFFIVCLLSAGKVFRRRINPLFKFCGLIAIAILLLCIGYFVQENLQLPR